MNIETIKYFAEKPGRLLRMLGSKGLLNWMPDKMYVKLQFRLSMGRRLDLEAPKTYNEKLQWLKLYDRKPLYTVLVDKYKVRRYIADKIGEEYLIPLVGGPWYSAGEIDFHALPEPFVLKCNHNSGGVYVCLDKENFDIEAVKRELDRNLERNYYKSGREWPYKDVKPCIIAEKYMDDGSGGLRDYKIFCFNGQARFFFIASDRSSEKEETKFDFFDTEGKHLPFTNGHPNAPEQPPCPKRLGDMCRLAEKLAEGMAHARVDFYEVNGEIFFGEITLSHWSGMVPFDPPEWDEIIGGWLELPKGG